MTFYSCFFTLVGRRKKMNYYTYEVFQQKQKRNPSLFLEKLMSFQRELSGKPIQTPLQQLIKHLQDKRLRVAFCGHFSAGKSTIINQVIGQKLLPSNPIPTSANVVTLSKGEAYMRFYDEQQLLYEERQLNWNKLKKICQNSQIKKIEVAAPTLLLPTQLLIMDTPGIDSTDEAHEIATMSQLYLADVIVYVMDYNHVLSEMNLAFLQSMTKRGKRLILLINQIDKHREEEISIIEYKEKITNAWQEANIAFEHLFFTTMLEQHHALNEYPLFIEVLNEMLAHRENVIYDNVHREWFQLLLQYQQELYEQEKSMLETYQNQLPNRDSLSIVQKKQMYWMQKEKQLTEEKEQFIEQFLLRLKQLFENANVMPYHTRELGRAVVEVSQVDFRIRGLFGKRKTKKEQKNRYTQFLQSLNDNCLTSIEIPLKKELLKHLQDYDLTEERWRNEVHHLHHTFIEEEIKKQIKKGAVFTDAYVRQFWRDITIFVEKIYRELVVEIIDKAMMKLQKTSAQREKKMNEQLSFLHQQIETLQAIQQIEHGIDLEIEKWLQFFTIIEEEATDKTQAPERESEKLITSFENIEKDTIDLASFMKEKLNNSDWIDSKEHRTFAMKEVERMMNDLPSIEWLEDGKKLFQNKLKRMTNHTYTVALFGAFSAGKSTFANAWLGGKLFPASPNPTTAVIQQLMKPTDMNKDGDVVVFYKTEEQIVEDINRLFRLSQTAIISLEQLEVEQQQFEEWKKNEEKKQIELEKNQNEKEEQENVDIPIMAVLSDEEMAFVQAVQQGASFLMEKLGTQEVITERIFQDFVTKESVAVFIEKVELYKDCEVTKKGIMLVDTPGSGSMNERHTQVAFNMIKHSDAILFLTYYNHAFSKYDDEFLRRIGQMNEFFDHDKLTFIINASDLAHSYQELQDVYEHLQKQLQAFHLEHSMIFPVSSLQALLGEKQTSGFAVFQSYFETYLQETLHRSNVEQLRQMALKMKEQVEESLFLYEEAQQKKETQLKAVENHINELANQIHAAPVVIEEDLLVQEIKELLYYVKQRVYYRYYDEFKEIFTPEILKKDDSIIVALQKATKKIVDFTILDTIQDLRATTARVEYYMEKRIHHFFEEMLSISNMLIDVSLEPWVEFIVHEKDFPDISMTIFQELYKPYKTHQDFFAEEGVKRVRDGLDQLIQPYVTAFMKQCEDQIIVQYKEQFVKRWGELCQASLTQLEQAMHYERQRFMNMVDKNTLQKTKEQLEKVISLFP